MSKKDNCSTCKKTVAKSAKALKCENCAEWHHVNCLGLGDVEYDFMSGRRSGFRWFCPVCDRALKDLLEMAKDGLEERIKDSVSALMGSALENFQSAITERLDALEARVDLSRGPDQPASESSANRASAPAPETFASIVRETLEQSKRTGEQPRDGGITINAFGKTKTVQDQQVVIVKSKSGEHSDPVKLDRATNDIKKALKTVPVNNIRKTNAGSLVVKFPSAEAKSEAGSLISACFENDEDFVVSQPRKMLPKMTLTGIPISYPDSEIVESILCKNKDIEALVDQGLQLEFIFSKPNKEGGHKIAVVRVAPEIRAAVNRVGGYIFVGLTRCRAYDRFWITQCFHCQRYGHIATKCPMKDSDPVCGFCAGSHKSAQCPEKSAPKCVNCSSRAASDGSCDHYALSPSCPMMALQRERVIENTNLVSSKNL